MGAKPEPCRPLRVATIEILESPVQLTGLLLVP